MASWLNAWCAADAVTIGCPLSQSWQVPAGPGSASSIGRGITEVLTNNAKDRAPDIAEYLADARVARAVALGLRAG